MNRSQKKCFLASTGLHLSLLTLMVLFNSAFLSSQKKLPDLPLIEFTPVMTTDEMVTGGGNPHGRPLVAPAPPPPPAPVQPTPKPQPTPEPALRPPPRVREPEPPPKEVVKTPQPAPEPETLVPQPETKRKRPKINLNNVPEPDPASEAKLKKQAAEKKKLREEREAREQEQAEAEARRKLLRQVGQMASRIGSEVSGNAAIDIKDMLGPGGGGVPYANFYLAVKSVYEREWVVPDGVTDQAATTTAEVTIGRDGTVLSWRIVRPSGNAAVDQTVRWTLNRVKFAAPLPPGVPEDHRTVPINFIAKPKSSRG